MDDNPSFIWGALIGAAVPAGLVSLAGIAWLTVTVYLVALVFLAVLSLTWT